MGRLLIINQPTCSLAVALAKWNCVSEFPSTFCFQSLQFLLQRSAPWIRGFKPSWIANFLISRNEGDEFAIEKPISFLAIVVCAAVINFSSPNFLAIWKNQLSILQQCESEHLLSCKINRLALVCVRLACSLENGHCDKKTGRQSTEKTATKTASSVSKTAHRCCWQQWWAVFVTELAVIVAVFSVDCRPVSVPFFCHSAV